LNSLNYFHETVCRWLSELGVSYTTEFPVGRWSLDIYIRELNLGVEVDGPQHSHKKDALRDKQILEQFDIPIVRIPVGTKKRKCLEAILGNF